MRLCGRSPPGSTVENISGASPPSPLLLRAPTRFMATARVCCASGLSAPSDMAEVMKRGRMASAGSTSSMGMEGAARNSRRSRTATGARPCTMAA